ncbi:MAG: PHP domain-containing protein [Planctomycetota bacterium]|mgnify:CR=1 FL=1
MKASDGGSDLHVHSNRSDGTLLPREIAEAAKEAGLSRVALTDHDTIEGWAEFEAAARAVGLEPVSGVELTTYLSPDLETHVVGLFVDPANEELRSSMTEFRRIRTDRIGAILEQLKAAGVDLPRSDVEAAAAGTHSLGRPHVAEALVRRGLAGSIPEAFHRFLVPGKPGYVSKAKITPADAVRLIRGARGIPIWAHPGQTRADVVRRLPSMLEAGVAGLEAWYPGYSVGHIGELGAIARDHGLLLSGGSDFHGERKEGSDLGTIRVPESAWRGLEAARTKAAGAGPSTETKHS